MIHKKNLIPFTVFFLVLLITTYGNAKASVRAILVFDLSPSENNSSDLDHLADVLESIFINKVGIDSCARAFTQDDFTNQFDSFVKSESQRLVTVRIAHTLGRGYILKFAFQMKKSKQGDGGLNIIDTYIKSFSENARVEQFEETFFEFIWPKIDFLRAAESEGYLVRSACIMPIQVTMSHLNPGDALTQDVWLQKLNYYYFEELRVIMSKHGLKFLPGNTEDLWNYCNKFDYKREFSNTINVIVYVDKSSNLSTNHFFFPKVKTKGNPLTSVGVIEIPSNIKERKQADALVQAVGSIDMWKNIK